MRIYLIRHAKDIDGYRGGWSQIGLSEKGLQQAYSISKLIYEHRDVMNIKRIISSDLKRAVQTAVEIGNKLQIKVELSSNWRETNNGKLAGMKNEEAEKLYPGLYYSSLGINEKYPEGESPKENYDRVKDSFYSLLEEISDFKSNILLVTHSGVINIIYHIINEINWSNSKPFFKTDYVGIHYIEYDKDILSFQENIFI